MADEERKTANTATRENAGMACGDKCTLAHRVDKSNSFRKGCAGNRGFAALPAYPRALEYNRCYGGVSVKSCWSTLLEFPGLRRKLLFDRDQTPPVRSDNPFAVAKRD
jgi:hypothetical protein